MAVDGGTVNGDIADRLVSYRLALLRYEGGTTTRLLTAYDAAFADINGQIDGVLERIGRGEVVDVARLSVLREKSAELAEGIRQLRAKLADDLRETLAEVAEAEGAIQETIFRDIGAGFAQVPDGQVAAAIVEPIGGGIWTDRLAADLVEANDGIQDAVARGLARGASMPEVARLLRRGTDIVETYRNRLVAIARTEVQRVANTVAWQTYQANEDVLAGVEWLATLDSRTCLVCAPLHGKTWTVADARRGGDPGMPPGYRRPPLHPRCRCFLAPISKSWHALGLDPDRRHDGEPPADMTFDAWLRRADAEEVAEFFGSAEREAMWRSGTPLEAFSDRGRLLGLGELRARARR